ncbi:serine/threonine-protein kinase [Rubinisphaera sp.]|uniref:serine/threonine protein kinase n=1 Tax=Rubinisphaera sp. TaxID=2024857 RepID=UPI000C0F12EA|nr:serine/threonine-protein kinase [Rubinisphaera sp.]MBV11628.1 hypothetical protein [Rubinisphaera sp.]HCS51391.1 hypothetical protein [Planctomycetaceae bacterium]|tara:strand:- start:12010 stop:14814 length:2805 start_codon:yes stop_codon:yes gene_type:complete
MSSSAQDIPSTAYRGHSLDPVTVIRSNPTESSQVKLKDADSTPPDSSLLARLFPGTTGREEQPNLPDNLRLGQYMVESRIGAGGMGAVFKARDEQLDRTIALKVLSPSQANDTSSIKRFHNEAKSAARLDHENVARIYSIGEDKGLHYIAFEYVEGITIRELIRRRGSVDSFETVNLLLQIAVALKHTAAAGVVHRDIKPSNLIMMSSGKVKLVDWGLARKERLDEQSLDLTVSGTTLGTFDYISPEQARDPRNVDVRSDIYSLGCTAYHMLTGVPPYADGTVLQKLLDHQGKPTPDPRDKNPNIPRELARIVKKMMASDPDDRYWSPQSLIEDLLEMAAQSGLRAIHPDGLTWQTSTAGSTGTIPMRLFWWWLGTFAIACVVAITFDRWSLEQSAQIDNDLNRTVSTLENDGSTQTFFPAEMSPDAIRNQPSGSENSPLNSLTNSVDSTKKSSDLTLGDDRKELSQIPPGYPSPITNDLVHSEDIFDGFFQSGSIEVDWGRVAFEEQQAGILRADITEQLKQDDSGSSVNDDGSTGMNSVEKYVLGESSQFRLITREGQDLGFQSTLESALEAIPDGGVIEFLGKPGQVTYQKINQLKIIDKSITISGSTRSELILQFDTSQFAASSRSRDFIVINGGSLTIKNLHLQVAIPDAVTQAWSLFLVEGTSKLRCSQSTFTVDSRYQTDASIVKMNRSAQQIIDEMSQGAGAAAVERLVQFEECFFRGVADLVSTESSDDSTVEVSRSLLTLDGALIRFHGDKSMRAERDLLTLRLSRVTALLNDGLIRLDLGMTIPRQPVDLKIRTEDSLILGRIDQPMIQLSAGLENRTLEGLLHWDGNHNILAGWKNLMTLNGSNSIETETNTSATILDTNSRELPRDFLEYLPRLAWDQWSVSKFYSELEMAASAQDLTVDLTAFGPEAKLLPNAPTPRIVP